jgi:hypothetical protein
MATATWTREPPVTPPAVITLVLTEEEARSLTRFLYRREEKDLLDRQKLDLNHVYFALSRLTF